MSNPVLTAAREQRNRAQAKLNALLIEPTAEERSLNDDEVAKFEELAAKIKKLDEQIDMISNAESRKAEATEAVAEVVEPAPTAPVHVTGEPLTYSPTSRNSYLYDMAAVSVPQAGFDVAGAQERLSRHAREVEVEAKKNTDLAHRLKSAQEARATDTVNGYGGDLVPPIYLIDRYVPFFRPGRPAANRVTNMPLPPGTDSINVPKITTGTLTAAQGAPSTTTLSSVTSQDLVTSTVTAAVNTYAGQNDVSLQLIEQSPIAIDEVIFSDLTADYDQRIDIAILSGSGSSGQHQGVITYAAAQGTNQIATNSTASTAFTAKGGVFTSIVSAVNQIETTRFANPTGIWVHPRRANSFGAQVDGNTRPLFVKAENAPWNALGVDADGVNHEGIAGQLYGLPVLKDANIPTVANTTYASGSGGVGLGTWAATGGTQDVIVVCKEDDLMLWEGPLRLRVLPEVSSGTLAVRFQLYAYSAFMPNRAVQSTAFITGPVLATAQLGF